MIGQLADIAFRQAHGVRGDPAKYAKYGLDDGLRVQLAVLNKWRNAGEQLGGWKVGFTSGSNRDKMGVGFRPFGYVLASRIIASGSRVSRPWCGRVQIEPEICFTLASDVGGPNVAVAEIRAAVERVSAAFEINEIRNDPGAPDAMAIADDLGNWGVVVGTGTSTPRPSLPETAVEIFNEGRLEAKVKPREMLDDPYLSVARLCGTLDRFGLGLCAGQVVITGAFSHHGIDGPGAWQAVFDGIGEVSLTFAD